MADTETVIWGVLLRGAESEFYRDVRAVTREEAEALALDGHDAVVVSCAPKVNAPTPTTLSEEDDAVFARIQSVLDEKGRAT